MEWWQLYRKIPPCAIGDKHYCVSFEIFDIVYRLYQPGDQDEYICLHASANPSTHARGQLNQPLLEVDVDVDATLCSPLSSTPTFDD
jgi:hypothetical protein